MTKADYRRILKLGFPFELLNRDLRLIFASNLIGSFGDGLFAYILPDYMTKTLNATGVEVGILYAIVPLISAVTLFVAGMLADRYDRKKIMVVGWLAWMPAPLIFSAAGNWLQMMPGMVLWGVWLGGSTTTAYVVTTANKDKLTLTFTAVFSAWSLGYVFSPALGGYLAEAVGMRIVFYSSFILYTLAGLTLTFIHSQKAEGYKQDASKEQRSYLKLVKTKELLRLSLFFASVLFVIIMFRPFVVKFLGDVYGYGKFEIGVLGSVSYFGSVVLGILLGRIGDRWKKSLALSISMMLCSVTLVLLLLFNIFPILLITFFLTGGSYTTWSLMSAIIGPRAPESIRARWVSIPQTISMLSSFIAPYIGGILYDISPYYLLFTAVIATFALGLLASFAES